jgi:hypothetical protein
MASEPARETRAFAAEIKFLVPHTLGLAIRDWARRHLQADPHGAGVFGDEYRTSTIYFDSPDYDVFHRRGSFGRSKYRIRRYEGSPEVFLERKLRRPGLLAKRRTPVPTMALARLEGEVDASWPGLWFQRRLLLRRLRPVCEISYHRVARFGMSPSGPVRLTLDESLGVCPASRPSFNGDRGDRGIVGIVEQNMILELKFRSQTPALFKQLVEEFSLVPQTASKYRLGLAAIEPAGLKAAASNGHSSSLDVSCA